MNEERKGFSYDQEEEEIDLLALAKVLYKKKWQVAKVTAACAILGAGVTLAWNPGYEAKATLRVNPPRSITKSMLDSMELVNGAMVTQIMNTYGEVIKSRSVLEEVIKGLNNPEDQGKDINLLVDAYGDRIKVTPGKNNAIMTVEITGKDEAETKKFSRLLMDTFLVKVASLEQQGSRETTDFVAAQLSTAKEKRDKAQQALWDFQQDNKMLSADDKLSKEKAQYDKALAMRENAKIQLKSLYSQLESINKQFKDNGASLADNALINEYQRQLGELSARLAVVKSGVESKEDPTLLEKQLQELRQKLDQEVAQVSNQQASSTSRAFERLVTKKVDCEVAIAIHEENLIIADQLEAEFISRLNALSLDKQKYIELERDARNTNDIYVTLVRRLAESRIANAAENSAIRLMDPPAVTKAKRKGAMKVGIAFMLGLVGSAGFIVGKELLAPKFRKADAVTDSLGLKLLAVLPHQEAAQLEAYRRLRANVMALENVRTLMVAAHAEDDFRAAASRKLAELLALAGFAVAYVNTAGLAALAAGAKLQEEGRGLFSAVAEAMAANGNELLAGRQMSELLAALRERYDYIIVDAPALAAASDGFSLAGKVDGVIYAVAEDVTEVSQARNDVLQLEQAGAAVVGAIYKDAR